MVFEDVNFFFFVSLRNIRLNQTGSSCTSSCASCETGIWAAGAVDRELSIGEGNAFCNKAQSLNILICQF